MLRSRAGWRVFDVSERPPLPLDEDERFALMALIVASLDARLSRFEEPMTTEPILCARLRRLLVRDIDLHGETVADWSCREEPDPQNGFPITPLMRAIARDVRAAETSPRTT